METTRFTGNLVRVDADEHQKDQTEGLYLAVSEPNRQGYIECLPAENKTLSNPIFKAADSDNTCLHHESDVAEIIGQIPSADLQAILEERIASKVKAYFDVVHRPLMDEPFKPGEARINYGGRVYDEDELIKATETCLEFYLTAGRHDKQFNRVLGEKLSQGSEDKIRTLTVNSGSSANLLAISCLTSPKLGDLRLREGDEVITVACGFPTTIAPIVQNRLIPTFVDVEANTLNVDPDSLEKAITQRTRAIMLAHTLGIPFNINKILEIAEKHQLWVIEDNCDALGGTYKPDRTFNLIKNKRISGRQSTGTFGHIGTSSFYPAHHITMGEGGAVYTSDPDLYRIMLSMRDWGRDCHCTPGSDNTCKNRFSTQHGLMPFGYDHKYVYSHLGYNLKITDIQAAIGLAQLKKLSRFSAERLQNWNMLREGLRPLQDVFLLPSYPEHAVPSPFGFALTLRDDSPITRDDATRFLEANQIQTRTVFAGNMLRQPALVDGDIRLRVLDGPIIKSNELTIETIQRLAATEKVMKDTFWIGVYPGLKPGMVKFIIDKLFEIVRS